MKPVGERAQAARPSFVSADLTATRVRHEWLRAASQDAQNQTEDEFWGKGRRNLKSKRDLPRISDSARRRSIRDGRLRVKDAFIPVVRNREPPS